MPKNNTIPLTRGMKFNRLTLIKYNHSDKRWRRYYLWKCDCGNETIAQGSGVVSGNTKSCGCYGTEVRKSRRISENHCEITAIILQYKRHAKKRGFEFFLSRDFVADIVSKNCHYCGTPPSNFMRTKNSIKGLPFNGIDRVDSIKNYTEDNVVPCCKICNNAKLNYSAKEFLEWVKRVYKHSIK